MFGDYVSTLCVNITLVDSKLGIPIQLCYDFLMIKAAHQLHSLFHFTQEVDLDL